MSETVPSLGEFEVQVLRLVWQEQPCTERRITDRVQEDRPVAHDRLEDDAAARGEGAAGPRKGAAGRSAIGPCSRSDACCQP